MHNVLTDSGPAVPVMLGDKELTTYKKTVMLTHTNVTENHRKGKKKRTGSRRRPRNPHITWPFNDCWLMILEERQTQCSAKTSSSIRCC